MKFRMVRGTLALLGASFAIVNAAGAQAVPPGPTPPARHSVVGVVARESGEPIEQVEVWLVLGNTRVATTRTDETGHFLLGGEAGAGRLVIRRLGFRSRHVPLELPRDTLRAMLIMLEPVPAELTAVEVTADGDELGGWLHDFNERRRANRFGRFMTRDDIKRTKKTTASELLRNTPGVTLAGARLGNVVRFRGCRDAPLIWIDGARVPFAEFDEVARPEDIAGLEVYTSPAGVPAEFTDKENSGCGTIVIWTRHQ